MDLSIRIYTWWKGQLVGTDEFGNRYYQEKRSKKFAQVKRWVLYKGLPEASKVSSQWHGWLHYTIDQPPLYPVTSHTWQKKHLPNLTGTDLAYHPNKTSTLYPAASRHVEASDYEPWKP